MPQLPMALRKERAARLRAAGDAALDKSLQQFVGQRVDVLMESETQGRSAHFAAVTLTGPQRPGAIIAARVTGLAAGKLTADAVSC